MRDAQVDRHVLDHRGEVKYAQIALERAVVGNLEGCSLVVRAGLPGGAAVAELERVRIFCGGVKWRDFGRLRRGEETGGASSG